MSDDGLTDAGVSLVMPENQINHLTDQEQDDVILSVAKHLENELRNHVMDARPRSDLKFWVTGPHEHPFLGRCHIHHLAGKFRISELHPESGAMKAYRLQENADPTLGVNRV